MAENHVKKAPIIDVSGCMIGVVNRSNITCHAVNCYLVGIGAGEQ